MYSVVNVFLKLFLVLILALSPALWAQDQIVFSKKLGRYVDGPVVGKNGRIFFANGNSIMELTKEGKVRTFHKFRQKGPAGKPVRLSGATVAADGTIYFSDYKNQQILSLPFAEGYKKASIKSSYHNRQMKQPNDIAVSSGKVIFAADHPKKKVRKGGVWVIPLNNPKGKTFVRTGGVPSGVAFDPNKQRLVVASGKKGACFIKVFDVIEAKLQPSNTIECKKAWSVDGMDFDKKSRLYISRPGLGRVDIFDLDSGKDMGSLCLLEGTKPKLLKGSEVFKKCKVSKKYKAGLYPTNLKFIDDDKTKILVTFLGKKGKGSKEQRGFIRRLRVPVEALENSSKQPSAK